MFSILLLYNEFMRISYSALDTFERCPLQYKFRYIDKIPTPKRPELFFGGLIHKIVQEALKKDPAMPSLEELLTMLEEKWEHEVFESDQNSQAYLTVGQNMIRNFYHDHKPGLTNIVAIEKRFQIPLSEKHTLSGAIDRIDQLPFGPFEIIDYKTNHKLPALRDLAKPMQLAIYKLATEVSWPSAKEIRVTYYFLKHNKKIPVPMEDVDSEIIKKEIIKIADKIEKTKEFKPKVSFTCDWCDYQDRCPKMAHKFRDKSPADEKIDEIVGEYLELINKEAELERTILEHMDKEKIESFHHKKGVVTRSKSGKFTVRKNS